MAYRRTALGDTAGCPWWAPQFACDLLLAGTGAGLAISNDLTQASGAASAAVPFDSTNPLSIGWDFGVEPATTTVAVATASAANAISRAAKVTGRGFAEGALTTQDGIPNWFWLAGGALVLLLVLPPVLRLAR